MMTEFILPMIIALFAGASAAPIAKSGCSVGSYEAQNGEIAVLTNPSAATGGEDFRYTFLDGRRGKVADPDAPLECRGDAVTTMGADGQKLNWRKQQLRLTSTRFQRDGISFAGLLIEPETSGHEPPPLAVTVAGSERTSSIAGYYPYILAAQGIATFVYDKRGTGASGGEYTQNFHVLGADAAAAMMEAQRLAAGRFSRVGFFGGSQAGWIAPLAAHKTRADYVVVGFGLIATPLEEDAEQVFDELRRKGYGDEEITKAREVTKATSEVIASHFTAGFEALDEVKRKYAAEPWLHAIRGEFTGDLLKHDEQLLRAEGRQRFDNLQIDWTYDALGLLRELDTRQLWVLAGADREAPVPLTIQRLALLQLEGKPIDVFIFQNTDHGITEFTESADGTRKTKKVADGYLRLIADWIKGRWRPPYGAAVQFKRTR